MVDEKVAARPVTQDGLANGVLERVYVDGRALEERVHEALREKILARALLPGTVLTIRQVAAALDVSPTPVRDALRRLQAEGLVRDRGRLGAEVIGLSAHDIADLFGARAALETYAARIAGLRRPADTLDRMQQIVAQFPKTFVGKHYTDFERFSRLDAQFHRLIIDAAENIRLTQMYEALHVHIQLARIYQRDTEPRTEGDYSEHCAIVLALEHGNPEAMAQAITAHINNVRDHLLRMMVMMGPDYRI